MISFLQPLALFGLAAAAIPTLLHLMGRRLPPVVVFPAVRYLTATEREHSRRLKLRNLLLLLLRTAVILCVVLAAARPISPVGGGSAHPPTAVAFVIDNSLSSEAVVDGRRTLDWIREAARTALERVEPGDRLWLVFADGLPRRVTRLDAGRALDSVAPAHVRMDLGEAVRTAARAVANDPLVTGEVVVFSDLQTSALSAGDPAAVPVLAWRPPDPPANRWIDTAYAEPAIWSPAGAVIAGVGGAVSQPTAVRLVVRDSDLARAVATTGDRVVLSAGLASHGWAVAAVEIDPDELRADDRRLLALYRREPAAATVGPGVGNFTVEAVDVLKAAGRLRDGREVLLADGPGTGSTIVFPPADPALVGALNRSLAARGAGWRLEELVEGEWEIDGDLESANGVPVFRRHRLEGSGTVLARAGGEPWIVRDGNVILVASRFEVDWTALPVSAAFVPFTDVLINRVAARQSWIITAAPQAGVELPPTVEAVLYPGGGSMPAPSDRRVSAPADPGVYFLTGAAGDTVGALEVNHDARESDLGRAGGRELRASLGDDLRVLSGRGLNRALFRAAGRADLAPALLALAIVAALVEFAVASRGGATERRA